MVRIFLILKYIIVNSLRENIFYLEKKINIIAPELKKVTKTIVLIKFWLNIIFPVLFLFIVVYFNYELKKYAQPYSFEITLIAFLFILLVGFKLYKFKIKNELSKLYTSKFLFVFSLMESNNNLSNLFIVNVLILSILNLWSALLFNIIEILFFIGLSIAKLRLKDQNFVKYTLSLLAILLSILLIEKNSIYSIEISSSIFSQINKIALVVLLFIIVRVFIKPKLFDFSEQTKQVFKLSIMTLVVVVIALIVSEFVFLSGVKLYLLLIAYFFTLFFMKIRYFKLLTIESLGYFNFYIAKVNNMTQKNVIDIYERNNLFLIMPIFLFFLGNIILLCGLKESLILTLFAVLEYKLDLLVMYMMPKIVKRKDLEILYTKSSKGITAAIFIVLPITLTAVNITTGISYSDYLTWVLLIGSMLYAIVFYLSLIWRHDFFKNLKL